MLKIKKYVEIDDTKIFFVYIFSLFLFYINIVITNTCMIYDL